MRIIEEKWLTAGYSVEFGEQQRATPEGLPLFAPDGTPEMDRITVLVLVRQDQSETHTIRIPFGEQQKQKLIADLSGGIVLAGPGDMGGLRL